MECICCFCLEQLISQPNLSLPFIRCAQELFFFLLLLDVMILIMIISNVFLHVRMRWKWLLGLLCDGLWPSDVSFPGTVHVRLESFWSMFCLEEPVTRKRTTKKKWKVIVEKWLLVPTRNNALMIISASLFS